ncbi:MAG: SDR family NAD(P)-dependent oxidoreductase, partial [Sandaracinaceae bacterium]
VDLTALMLEVSMDLEGDVGVDSIKRVEIRAAMRERASDLPEVDPAELGKLRTLAEIVERMGGSGAAASTPAAPSVDLTALMLEVVAEKTGYPTDMLELSMDLEGDLGVDSIKRVEILAAMRERASDLPEVDPAELGKLRTLAEIVERMGGSDAAASSAAAVNPAALNHVPSAPSVDLTALMLEVVAEKTGYPSDMLELSMDLEGDLGVDSIKRVEILAAMRERASDLPEVDPAELGKLRTLAEIVERMGGGGDVASSSAGVATPASSAAVGRYTLRLHPASPSGFALKGLLSAERIVVVDGGSGVGEALVARLQARGVRCAAGNVDDASDGVIFLGGLSEAASVDDALAIQRAAFELAHLAAPALRTGPSVFVTVQDTGGDFGLTGAGDRAWLGGLPGLVKTAAQEWPEVGARAIDLERGGDDAQALAERLATELLAGGSPRPDGASGGGTEVALRADGGRYTLVSEAGDAATGTLRVQSDSVIVASGGARGVTATTLIALAEASKARFVLLGRTPLVDEPAACQGADGDAAIKQALLSQAKASGQKLSPKELGAQAKRILAAREVRGTLSAIESAGGQARYVAADVRDRAALSSALDEVRGLWGPITGIVHGAGVLADKLIADKSLDDFDFVFGVKVGGLRALLEATKADPLSTLVVFSSVAGRCGNRGQADYAMANETLAKVVAAESARREGLFVRSLGWGPWAGGMVTPALERHFASMGVPLIPLAEGARMLVEELADMSSHQELVLGGEPRPEPLAGRAAGPKHTLRYDVVVDRATFPAIEDHRVKGQPVLPVAFVLELFARAVEASRPDLHLTRIEEVQVLKGVALEQWDGEGERLTVTLEQVSNGDGVVVRLGLVDADGRARYRGRGIAARHPASAAAAPGAPSGLRPFEGGTYAGPALFHGDRFQVLKGQPDFGEKGASATLHADATWAMGDWRTDPALVDGALQLALLWTCHTDGGAALPTSVEGYCRYGTGPIGDDARAVLVAREFGPDRSLSDVTVLDGNGQVVFELRGVEIHVLPGSRAAAQPRA